MSALGSIFGVESRAGEGEGGRGKLVVVVVCIVRAPMETRLRQGEGGRTRGISKKRGKSKSGRIEEVDQRRKLRFFEFISSLLQEMRCPCES